MVWPAWTIIQRGPYWKSANVTVGDGFPVRSCAFARVHPCVVRVVEVVPPGADVVVTLPPGPVVVEPPATVVVDPPGIVVPPRTVVDVVVTAHVPTPCCRQV